MPLQDWHEWNRADEIETKGSFYTDDKKYSGDGYIKDFSLGMTSEEFQSNITALLDETPSFLDFNTAVLIISFNCYEPSQDRFVTT